MRESARFVVNALSNWVQQGVYGVVGIVLLPYALHRLGQERYGLFGIAASMAAVFHLLEGGLSGAISRFSAQAQGANDLGQLRETTSVGTILMGALGAASGVGVALVGMPVARAFRVTEDVYASFLGLMVCMGAVSACRTMGTVSRGVLTGANRYDVMNGIDIATSILRLGLVVCFFETLGPSLVLLGLGYGVPECLRLLSLNGAARWLVLRGPLFKLGAVTRQAVKRLVGFSVWNLMALVGGTILEQGPNLVVGRLLGSAMVAALAPPLAVAANLRAIVGGLCSPLVPLAGRDLMTNEGRRLGEWSLRLGRVACTVSLAIAMPLCIFASPVLRFWLGEELVWTAPVFVIMTIGSLLATVQASNYFLVLGGGRLGPIAVSILVSAVLAMAALVVGEKVFHWGLVGAAATVAVAVLVRNTVYIPVVCCKAFGVSVKRYYWEVYGAPALAAAPAAGLSMVMMWSAYPQSGLVLLAQMLLNAAVYGVMAWRLVLHEEDRGVLMAVCVSAVQALRAFRGGR